ncbi:hypothetical protein EJ04DRAFT_473758 [Polyplosphaeria fusca]|uniref:DHH phosphoesterase n=1 Tax=Polyplosphaeria fusca TaxID=682080 RepID=A0A9P4QN51_9PLEO|nr:hypothetical protein EJ04DRAFT_473758 [Polyplosphaeria fusca]
MMRNSRILQGISVFSYAAFATPLSQPQQAVINGRITPDKQVGVGHFSEWSRATKKEFLIDWQAGREDKWIFVQGNEGGDTDSMTAALTWAYHLGHATQNTSDPLKAIALLQTPTHALDLRPENKKALENSKMTAGHEDLLTIDELPEDPETLSRKLRGIVLVDHAKPLRKWNDAKILSIFDHHKDEGAGKDADPRVFEKTASCTTIVARQMLDELEKLSEEYHMPHELLELILSAIAIDSSGLKEEKSTKADVETSKRVLARSNWREKDLSEVMEGLDNQLNGIRNALDHLGLRDLLRRDWKGDLVDTPSPQTPTISLGFASIPYSFDEQIEKTEFSELFDWFAIHAAWTAEMGVDISVCLNKYKIETEDGTTDITEKKKIREIVLVVRDDVRIDAAQADALFKVAREAIEKAGKDGLLKELKPWHNAPELGVRQMVWTHESDAGRKDIRPLVEEAVMTWD